MAENYPRQRVRFWLQSLASRSHGVMVERMWCLLQTGLQTRAIQEESILP